MEIGETMILIPKYKDKILNTNLFCINKSFLKEARKAEEEEKAHEPDMDVAEEGNILYKLNHARSRFTSDLISVRKNKKRHHLSMITPPGNEKP